MTLVKTNFLQAFHELFICLTNSSGEVRTLLIGCLSLAGVVLLLVALQTIGLFNFMCKKRAKIGKRKIIKTDINPDYGVDYETDDGDIDKTISTDYDYMK